MRVGAWQACVLWPAWRARVPGCRHEAAGPSSPLPCRRSRPARPPAEHLADLLLAGDTLPQPGAAPVGHAAASGDTSTSTESQTVADPDGWMLPHLELGVQAVLPLHPPQPLGRGQQAQQACVRPQLRPATAPLPGAQAALPPAPPLYFADPFGAPAAAGSLPGGLPGGAAAEPAGAAELEALLAELEPQLAAEEARVSLKVGAVGDALAWWWCGFGVVWRRFRAGLA